MYVVQFTSMNQDCFLRGSVWTFLERANRFETIESAQSALANAGKFMRKRDVKAAKIVNVDSIKYATDASREYHTFPTP